MGIMSVLILPLLVVVISGIVYIYRTVIQLMSKSVVWSKVVVITDALSNVGKAKLLQRPWKGYSYSDNGVLNTITTEDIGEWKMILSNCVEFLVGDSSLPEAEAEEVIGEIMAHNKYHLAECAQSFHTGGARLVLCGKYEDQLQALYDALSSVADPRKTFTPKLVLLDLADVNCIQDVAKEILDCYGCVDILINNASTKLKGTAQSTSLDIEKKIMDANYFGPITLTKAILPNMISRRTGQVVLVNNIQGKLGIPFRAAYAASKHAALGFFDCLRAELQEFGVCVSTVTPSFIHSTPSQPETGNLEASIWKFLARKLAYGVHPTEVAEEILRTVNRKKQEVFMANPIAKAAVYIRTFIPELFFAVVAAGVKEKQKMDDK